MALVPKISLSISNSCNKVDIWENTGLYHSTTNTGGWGTPNINTSVITSSVVNIYDYLGTSLLQTIILKNGSVDVYAGAVSAPTPASFKALQSNTWTQVDGIYKIEYTLTNGSTVYTNAVQYQLFTCNLCNCMQGLMQKMLTQCSGKKLDKYKDVYNQLELLKYGIESAFSCNDFTKVNNLLTNASTMCTTFSECGCGCDDCN